ncbi:unnamed protein product [Camellia sinensis]
MLCRLFLPSVEKAVRELEEEEMRLKPSIVSEFDQSHKFNKPSSSRDRSAMSSSSSMTETYDWRSLLGGMAKVAIASYAAVQVSRTLYNYYTEPVAVESFSGPGSTSRTLKILSNNVCFREDLEIHKRMKAVGGLIQLHSPDLICFQEVTLKIYDIFQQSSWWNLYRCSVSNVMEYKSRSFCMQVNSEVRSDAVTPHNLQLSKLPVKSYRSIPLRNSTMERKLCVAKFEVQADMPLVVATSHLKGPGPGPGDQKFSKERVDQDDLDGQFPLPNGWVDAWVQLKPGENGWTYYTKSNKMLYGDWPVQKRLDRFVCNLRDFKLRGIERIGMEAIPGLSYCQEKKEKNKVHMMLPVFPTDHYGLLLTICASNAS